MSNSQNPKKLGKWSKISIFALALAVFSALITFNACNSGGGGEDHPEISDSLATSLNAQAFAFRNSVNAPPPTWDGPVFELSHNYPQTLPAGGEDMPWLSVDVDFSGQNPVFEGAWSAYLQTIFDYVTRGQDPNLDNEIGWRNELDGQTEWYHVPWMAYDPNVGREFTHGCTSERVGSLQDFDGDGTHEYSAHSNPLYDGDVDPSTGRFETWAVGMYNGYAGFSIGQAFPESGVATTVEMNGQTLPAGFPFQTGSAVVKVLFTTATPEDAPVLEGAPMWTVNRHIPTSDTTFGCDRAPQPVYLVQMDVAVTDPRSPTNWVFGTFAYDGSSDGETGLERMVPVGVQYGNDPQSCPAVPNNEDQPVVQSILNEDMGIYQHFGCNQRLAGPVDNPISSCMSCHGGAYTAPMNEIDKMGTNIPPIFGFDGLCEEFNEDNKAYFSNVKYPEPYNDPKYANDIPLDYSLQVQVAFQQYKLFAKNGQPNECEPSQVYHDTVENSCE